MIGIIDKYRFVTKSSGVRCIALRYSSTETKLAEQTKAQEVHTKRYAKKILDREKKLFKGNFVNNLFLGLFDKKIFEYPFFLKNAEVESLLRHSVEVEDCISSVKYGSTINEDLLKCLRSIEVFGLTIPSKYGGLGYSETEARFIEECSGTNPQIGRFLSCNENLGIKILTLFGSEEQKQKYLPALASGECFATLAYLEDTPIVDLTKLEGSSVMDSNDSFRINARKRYVTNATLSDLIIVLTKTPTIVSDDFQLKFNLLITEKNNPGITVHPLKSKILQEFGICDVDFENVEVPKSSTISPDKNGYEILKTVLSYSSVSSAAICSSIIKKLIHSASNHNNETVGERSPLELNLMNSSLGVMTGYAYALESIIYLVSARCDLYENPDLFVEANIAKVFAIEALQIVIEKYIGIVGTESYKTSNVLEEALKILQLYSVLDGSIEHWKVVIGLSGMLHSNSSIQAKVHKIRTPHQHPWEAVKSMFTSKEKKISDVKTGLNLKQELHSNLSSGGDSLESCIGKLNLVVSEVFIRCGSKLTDEESHLLRLGEMATYIYAITACLARSSTAYCSDFRNSEAELDISLLFSGLASLKVEELCNHFIRFADFIFLHKKVGEATFRHKEYPADHPLSRTY